MQRIRILLADDHVLVRQGTRELLEREPDLVVVAEADDGQQAVALAAELQPDVAVLDAAMPGVNGIEATRRIKAAFPNTAVLILSAYDSDAYLFAAFEAGARGYLLKSSPAQELVWAVRTVHVGGSALHPTVARKLVDRFAQPLGRASSSSPSSGRVDTPSERELEVLRLAAQGLTNQDIARRLSIGQRTVQSHLAGIFAKTGSQSRTEAVVAALRKGWLSLEELEGDEPSGEMP
ncbi:MAG: response regulator [Anaerolineae bacterium]